MFPPVSTTEDTMCLAHIIDPYLQKHVEPFAEDGPCTVCTREGLQQRGQVVNLEELAKVVYQHAEQVYDHEGRYIEGEQLLTPLDTAEVVAELISDQIELIVSDLVCELTAELITESRDWFSDLDYDEDAMREFAWRDFEDTIKHESRLLFPPVGEDPTSTPERNFLFVQSLLWFAAEEAGLRRTLAEGTKLYRARTGRDTYGLSQEIQASPAKGLGPAPRDRVAAGRMNAQGVSVFYVALDEQTACAEVVSHSPYDIAVVGEFVLRQPLTILDLTTVPQPSSKFNDEADERDARMDNLAEFVQRIIRPVIVDGNHPVDYAPTQIITEAFRWWSKPKIDGIAYRSLNGGGTNVVLFYGEAFWFESDSEKGTNMDRIERDTARGSHEPVFFIDSKTVRRHRVRRTFSVDSFKM